MQTIQYIVAERGQPKATVFLWQQYKLGVSCLLYSTYTNIMLKYFNIKLLYLSYDNILIIVIII
jgi:hypothetical protein